jgi:hypothetical protein
VCHDFSGFERKKQLKHYHLSKREGFRSNQTLMKGGKKNKEKQSIRKENFTRSGGAEVKANRK